MSLLQKLFNGNNKSQGVETEFKQSDQDEGKLSWDEMFSLTEGEEGTDKKAELEQKLEEEKKQKAIYRFKEKYKDYSIEKFNVDQLKPCDNDTYKKETQIRFYPQHCNSYLWFTDSNGSNIEYCTFKVAKWFSNPMDALRFIDMHISLNHSVQHKLSNEADINHLFTFKKNEETGSYEPE